jgi:hypothetical protein
MVLGFVPRLTERTRARPQWLQRSVERETPGVNASACYQYLPGYPIEG